MYSMSVTWRVSSYSGSDEAGNCVEVAAVVAPRG